MDVVINIFQRFLSSWYIQSPSRRFWHWSVSILLSDVVKHLLSTKYSIDHFIAVYYVVVLVVLTFLNCSAGI